MTGLPLKASSPTTLTMFDLTPRSFTMLSSSLFGLWVVFLVAKIPIRGR